MVRTKILRIHQGLYARIPADMARRLRIRAGQEVDLEIRPIGASGPEIIAFKGNYKGQFVNAPDEALWSE